MLFAYKKAQKSLERVQLTDRLIQLLFPIVNWENISLVS